MYEGIVLLSLRQFAEGARLLLSSVATFSAYELMSYNSFVQVRGTDMGGSGLGRGVRVYVF